MTVTDATVAEYLGVSTEQVRLIKLGNMTCSACADVHPSYPQIKAFHSPVCKAARHCAECSKEMPNLVHGHEVGLICSDFYGASTNKGRAALSDGEGR